MSCGSQTQLRILDIFEVTTMDKTELDAALYAKYSGMATKSTNKVFDGYRTLRAGLQESHVYSRDAAGEAGKDPRAVVIDAVFPKTYSKSKLGIGLSESELQQRYALYSKHSFSLYLSHTLIYFRWLLSVSVLNAWMGALLTAFPRLGEEAQDRIVSFLSLEEDNPAEPQNRAMQAM